MALSHVVEIIILRLAIKTNSYLDYINSTVIPRERFEFLLKVQDVIQSFINPQKYYQKFLALP